MDINTPLLIMGELIFVLLVIIVFMAVHILRQKKIITRLVQRLHNPPAESEAANFYGKNTGSPNNTSIADFFQRSLADTLQRFHKHTGSNRPELHKDHPFGAKVAALRHMYLTAEQSLFKEQGVNHAGWGELERALAQLVHWSDQAHNQNDKQIRELQRQLKLSDNEVKKQQGKIGHLLKRLENLRGEQHNLEHLNTKNAALIDHLQDSLNRLKSTNPSLDNDHAGMLSLGLNNTYIDSFGNSSSVEGHNLRALLHEIKNAPSSFNHAQQKRVENQINLLEIELLKSDRLVGDLKKQLKDAKLQMTNYALMSRDSSPVGDIQSLYTELMKKISPSDTDDPDTIIAEINNLKASNQFKHDAISNLEVEISTLKSSINGDNSDPANLEKEKEIQRLERLVKECQGCIVILEEEVDSLYARLQEQTSQLTNLGSADNTKQPLVSNIEEMELLIQELARTSVNYQHMYAINNFLLDVLQSHTFAGLTEKLMAFINAFNLPATFYINCNSGEAEHTPEHLITPEQRKLLIEPESQETQLNLNDGTLFNYPNIRALLNTQDSESPGMLINHFQILITAINERLNDLDQSMPEDPIEQERHWNEIEVKEMLNNLNIRYAFQIDENRKTFDQFLANLRNAYNQLKLEGQGAIILDSAVNEFEMRMSLLLESGEGIDREISLLVEKMEQL